MPQRVATARLKDVTEPIQIGRYTIHGTLASGGMASVHLGKLTGPGGFARVVAVKRMHPHLAKDSEFVAMFVDEARLAARIRHPNVVATLDVLAASDELLIVMEYVHGESLAELVRLAAARKARMPAPVACAVIADVLAGLHAAHEATDEQGRSLGVVHRDVSPTNVLVGADGIARLADFGVARAAGRLQVTREGQVKGKIAYMAPEQVRGDPLGPAADIYGASVVLWEILTGRRLFVGQRDAQVVEGILYGAIEAPSAVASSVPEALNAVVLRGLARDPTVRFGTAHEMMQEITAAVRPASPSEVSDWVELLAADKLAERAEALTWIERERYAAAPSETTATPRHDELATAPRAAVDANARASTSPSVLRAALRPAVAVLGLGCLGVLAWRIAIASFPSAGGVRTGEGAEQPASVDAGSALTAATLTIDSPGQPTGATASVPVDSAARPADPVEARPRRAPLPGNGGRPPGRADCDPPYTIDADGTRHYKLRCL